jgi:hypothetical protein
MTSSGKLFVPHVVKGVVHDPSTGGDTLDYGDFVTPKLDLDELIWSRSEPGPAVEMPLEEIIDFLAELGERLDLESNTYLQEAVERSIATNDLGARILSQGYRGLRHIFNPESLRFQVEQEIGLNRLDGWAEVRDFRGQVKRIRAYPPRLIHILAGNAPGVTAGSIARGALSKGVHLLKLPSNDLFTGSAILRTMADIDADHPITRSFSCAYWRGGDPVVESTLFRAQFFDRLVAWGGDAAIRSAAKYVGPGFDLVSFDPKVSISLLGREALESVESMRESASAAAVDATLYNQEICAASRFIYAEGERSELMKWCEFLVEELGIEREYADAVVKSVPAEVRSEVESLRAMAPMYEVFGSDDGTGLVILSDEPVDFHPSGKTVNVVRVGSLQEAERYVNVATQTVGIYPASRGAELRNGLAARGMQRLVSLGQVINVSAGFPHDGFWPLHRFMKWLIDET